MKRRLGGRSSRLKLLDSEAGDKPEVAEIDGQDRETEFQRSNTDQQVGEGDSHAMRLLLAVDLCPSNAVAWVYG